MSSESILATHLTLITNGVILSELATIIARYATEWLWVIGSGTRGYFQQWDGRQWTVFVAPPPSSHTMCLFLDRPGLNRLIALEGSPFVNEPTAEIHVYDRGTCQWLLPITGHVPDSFVTEPMKRYVLSHPIRVVAPDRGLYSSRFDWPSKVATLCWYSFQTQESKLLPIPNFPDGCTLTDRCWPTQPSLHWDSYRSRLWTIANRSLIYLDISDNAWCTGYWDVTASRSVNRYRIRGQSDIPHLVVLKDYIVAQHVDGKLHLFDTEKLIWVYVPKALVYPKAGKPFQNHSFEMIAYSDDQIVEARSFPNSSTVEFDTFSPHVREGNAPISTIVYQRGWLSGSRSSMIKL